MSEGNRIAVVTGSGAGIGRACAVRLALDGADVAVMDMNGDALAETARAITANGRRALPITVDLLDRAATAGAFARVRRELGPIDILVNNVGQSARERARPFWEADPAVWDFVIDLNVRATMFCSRQVAPDMRERGRGRIVCISSEAAYSGAVGMSDYSTVKAALQGFVRSLAIELAPSGVTVNAVLPGMTRTQALESLPREMIDPLIAAIPMRQLCDPEDIAHAVSFFASAGARLITGTSLLVNGGRVMI